MKRSNRLVLVGWMLSLLKFRRSVLPQRHALSHSRISNTNRAMAVDAIKQGRDREYQREFVPRRVAVFSS